MAWLGNKKKPKKKKIVAAITSLVQSEVVEVESILLVKLFQLEAKNQVSLSEEILNVFFFDKKQRRCNGEVFAQEGRFTRRPLLLLHSIDNSWCQNPPDFHSLGSFYDRLGLLGLSCS